MSDGRMRSIVGQPPALPSDPSPLTTDLYDVVWYTPENAAKAMALIRRVPLDECRQRGIRGYGVRGWKDIPIPNADGTPSAVIARCVATNHRGWEWIAPGEKISNLHTIANKAEIRLIAPGLAVANVHAAALTDPELAKAAAGAKVSEESTQQRIAELSVHDDQSRAAVEQSARRRYLLIAAALAGAARPDKLSTSLLEDLYISAELMSVDLPDFAAFVSVVSSSAGIPAGSPGKHDPADDRIEDWDNYFDQAMSAANIQRKETTRVM